MGKKNIFLLSKKGKSKSPIEDTIQENWSVILNGFLNGHSRAAVRGYLFKDGLEVGSLSGFNAAISRVAKKKGVVIDALERAPGSFDLENDADDHSSIAPIDCDGDDGGADGELAGRAPASARSSSAADGSQHRLMSDIGGDRSPESAPPYFGDNHFTSPFGGSDA